MPVPDESSASYAELSSQAFGLVVDAVEAGNRRTIDYFRSIFAIARPRPTRTGAFVALTCDALGENNRAAAELAREGARIVAQARETYILTLRGVADTGVSNMAFLKNAASRSRPNETTLLRFN